MTSEWFNVSFIRVMVCANRNGSIERRLDGDYTLIIAHVQSFDALYFDLSPTLLQFHQVYDISSVAVYKYKYISYNIEIAFVKFHQFSHAYFIVKCQSCTQYVRTVRKQMEPKTYREDAIDEKRKEAVVAYSVYIILLHTYTRYRQPKCKHTHTGTHYSYSFYNMKYVKFAHEFHRTHSNLQSCLTIQQKLILRLPASMATLY